VRPASELEILDHRGTANGIRLHVMELEEPALRAAALGPDESTLTSVALPDFSSYGGRNVARA
jgi:hypothetical protein